MSATLYLWERDLLTLKYYVKTRDLLERLHTDKDGAIRRGG